MFNRETILLKLNAENYYIDKHSLALFLNNWKIDSIYEDDNGLEFYDELALAKLKKGISLKAQGYSDEQIVVKLQKIEPKVEKINREEPVKPLLVKDFISAPETANYDLVEETGCEDSDSTDLAFNQNKSFTLDVTSQTLQMLAEAVAKKISDDITNSDMATKLIEAGGYKKDNEILAKQVQELLEHNKELAARIEQLESQPAKSFWGRFWGQR